MGMCVHHWMVPEPDGTIEPIATCKKCNGTQSMFNHIPARHWNGWRGDPSKRVTPK